MDLSHLAQGLADLRIVQILWFAVGLTVARLALLRIINSSVRAFVEVLEAMLIAGVLVFLVIQPFAVKAFYIPSGSMLPTLIKNDHILVNKFIYRFGTPHREDIVVFNAPPQALAGTPEENSTDDQVDYIKRLIAVPGDRLEVHRGTVTIGNNPPSDHSEARARFGLDDTAESRDQQHLKFVPSGIDVYDGNTWTHYGPEEIASHFKAPPGTPVVVHPGYVVRNGQKLDEPYIAEDPDYDLRVTYDGHLLLDDPNEGLKLDGQIPSSQQILDIRKHRDGQIALGTVVVMGDNRNDSNDSTRWGPLDEHRLVGKAFFIFFPFGRGRVLP